MNLEELRQRVRAACAGGGPAGAHLPTGFPVLDALLGNRGWPCPGLVEILTDHSGIGALRLLVPALAAQSARGRWLIWVSPPYLPYVPALLKEGVATDRILIVESGEADPRTLATGALALRTQNSLWTFEQALRFPDAGASLAWLGAVEPLALRRLKLACEAGGGLGVMFRPLRFAEQASPAALRLALAAGQAPGTLGVRLLKGGQDPRRTECELAW